MVNFLRKGFLILIGPSVVSYNLGVKLLFTAGYHCSFCWNQFWQSGFVQLKNVEAPEKFASVQNLAKFALGGGGGGMGLRFG